MPSWGNGKLGDVPWGQPQGQVAVAAWDDPHASSQDGVHSWLPRSLSNANLQSSLLACSFQQLEERIALQPQGKQSTAAQQAARSDKVKL